MAAANPKSDSDSDPELHSNFSFDLDDDFGGLNDFQKDLQEELDEMSDEYINAEPRRMSTEDDGVPFSEIASLMVNLDPNGYVKKLTITDGVGELPPPYARVLIHYDFYKEGFEEPFDSTFVRNKPCRLRLDEGEMIAGLEMAIKSMRKKETAKFLFHWEVAFGLYGCPPRIPKKCTILAYISLLEFTPLIGDDVEGEEGDVKLTKFGRAYKDAKNCHCEGNDDFAAGNYRGAIRCYRKAIAMLNECRLTCEDEETKMIALKVKCLVNLSVCFNKISKPEQSCVVARQALSLQKGNVKAMFQYGKANLILSNLELAEKWLKKAQHLKPDDDDILRELGKLKVKKEKADAETKLFCQKAFSMTKKENDNDKDKKK